MLSEKRYQRRNLFLPEINYIGIGAGHHKDYGICVCIGYARNIRPLGSDLNNVLDYINEYVEYRDKQNQKKPGEKVQLKTEENNKEKKGGCCH